MTVIDLPTGVEQVMIDLAKERGPVIVEMDRRRALAVLLYWQRRGGDKAKVRCGSRHLWVPKTAVRLPGAT